MEKPRKYLAIFLMIPTDYTEEQEQIMRELVEARAYEVQCFFRYYLRHRFDIQCRGYTIRYDGYVDYPAYAVQKVEPWWKENGDPDWQYTHYLAWGKLTNPEQACGQAILGGNRGMINASKSTCGKGTKAHEFSHQFDMFHSGVVKEDGRVTEYGDDTDLQGGAGEDFLGYNSWHMLQMDMDTRRERYDVTDTCALLIRPIELPWNCLYESEYQHVVIGDITLSIRKVRGVEFPVKGKYEGVLFIHERDPDFQVKRLMPDMQVGDVRSLPNGYIINYYAYENETASIGVTRYGEEPARPLPINAGFPSAIVSAYVDQRHCNAWYNRDFTGQGLDVHVNADNGMAMFWYTASPNGGNTFYSASCVDIDANKEFDILAYSGGTWDNPSTYEWRKVGTGKLAFFNSASGVFHYNMPGIHDNGAIELVTVARSIPHVMEGIWYQPGPPYTGSGFSSQVFANGRMAMWWYTYDHDGKPVWFSCEGVVDRNGAEAYLDIYEVRNLKWMYFSKVEFAPVGKALVQYKSYGKLALSYDIDTGWVEDKGVFELTRLF